MQFNGPTSEQAQFMLAHGEDWDMSYFATCQCTSTGPERADELDAVAAWNARTSSGGVTSGEVVKVLENTQTLLAAMLHETRPAAEVETQIAENRAALSSLHTQPEGEPSAALMRHVHKMLAYHITEPPTADHEFVNVCNGDLRKLDELFAACALPQPQVTGSREAVAWLHNLTGVIRQDKPAAGMGLHEDYTHLFTLAQLQAVERELASEKSAFSIMVENNKMANAEWDKATARAETAEASLAAAERKGIERAAETVMSLIPSIPIDGPSDQRQEVEYSALGHAWTAICALELGDPK